MFRACPTLFSAYVRLPSSYYQGYQWEPSFRDRVLISFYETAERRQIQAYELVTSDRRFTSILCVASVLWLRFRHYQNLGLPAKSILSVRGQTNHTTSCIRNFLKVISQWSLWHIPNHLCQSTLAIVPRHHDARIPSYLIEFSFSENTCL